jgi:hypothetical protein
MPSYSRTNASDSESDEAPESISLSQSKKNSQKRDAERRNAEIAQRKAIKDKNRDRDRKLKKRAVMNKHGKAGAKDGGDEEEVLGSDRGRERDETEKRMQRAMKDAELESDGEESSGVVRRPDHLPDELFVAAFSSKRKITEDDFVLTRPEKKRKSSRKKGEDIIVGFVDLSIS